MSRKYALPLSENELLTLLVITGDILYNWKHGLPTIEGGTDPDAARNFQEAVKRLHPRLEKLLQEGIRP